MSNPAVVQASAPGSYGICIAFGQNAYTTSPTWTRIDDPAFDNLRHRVSSPYNGRFATSWTSSRGRSYEIDKTQTGTAEITVYDTSGFFDPTNVDGPFYEKIWPMMRGKISVQNPSDLYYYDIFTGFVESWSWTMDTAENIMTVKIGLVDGFEPLNRGELEPQANGVYTFPGDASSSSAQTRMNDILDLADWPTDGLVGSASYWRNINTGNIKLKETIYNPQTSFLSSMQDIADAEFPGVSNVFMNKKGAVTFYGRYPRFQPTNYPLDVNFWQAADRDGQAPSGGAALISDIEWQLDSKNLINAALCYPFGILQTDIQGQIVRDDTSFGGTSITRYGLRMYTLPDLINDGQNAGVGISAQPALGANAATKLFATYYVQNYAQPVLRISRLEFKSQLAGSSQTWKLMTGVEIGDIITIFTSNPGGGGFGKLTAFDQFFVEGIHNTVSGPLHGNIPEWTMSLDVSPRAWFPANYPIGG